MKATTFLVHQHKNLRELCDAVVTGSASMRASLLPQLASDLAANIAVEERVFYPAACAALHDEEWLGACHDRHVAARRSIDRALGASPDGEEFAEAIGELRGLVTRQAEEEESGLFPRLEEALGASEMRALGQSMLDVYDREVEATYASV